ncbi:CpXC protein [Nitzschia inconspicua]|uniref:CpXC protein n=1 Tax=Nitzschia inconspicua TaxID=303405 RepID=A0A9K3PLN2_9STRA|nr:CpXC protein [Nitzschia inconspicua]
MARQKKKDEQEKEDVTTSSQRRSSRKRTTVSYNEKKLEKIIGGEELESPKKRKSSTRGKETRQGSKRGAGKKSKQHESSDDDDERYSESGTKDSEEEEYAADNDIESEESESQGEDQDDDQRKPQAKKIKTGTSPEHTCNYCGKSFISPGGLEYHINRFVCRLEECKDPNIINQHNKKRKRGKGIKGKTKYKKFRGSKENRTCGECGRVFTSTLGLRYHASKQVCHKMAGPGKSTRRDDFEFRTLEKGETFVTIYGIVRVIRDNMATPTADPIQDAAAKVKKFKNDVGKHENRVRKYMIQRFAQLRARRERINALYQKGEVSQKPIFKAYLDPLHERITFVPPKDPLDVAGSFMDRIVECEWIADERTRFQGDAREEQEFKLEKPGELSRLFLRRRLLTEKYDGDGSVYFCDDCGKAFSNLPSHTYHTDQKPCKRRNERETSRREEIELKIQISAKTLRTEEAIIHEAIRRYPFKPRQRKSDSTSVYPEVLLALGFQLVKKEEHSREVMRRAIEELRAAAAARDSARNANSAPSASDPAERADKNNDEIIIDNVGKSTKSSPSQKVAGKEEPKLEHPLLVMEGLRKELKREMRIADDKTHGSMYSEVYHSLGFEYPGLKPPKIERPKMTVVVIKRKKNPIRLNPKQNFSKVEQKPLPSPPVPAPPPEVPLPPIGSLPSIIDPQALIEEALVGRYPSINRYNGEHSDVCLICKQFGQLLCCDFCETAEHWMCFRTKYTTKALEPGEDFMCHKCIGVVIARRNRAEKRRIGKVRIKGTNTNDDGSRGPSKNKQSDGNKQYHEVAEKGQSANELVELLRDSQDRLNQSVARLEMNNLRRKMMAGL